MLCIRKQFRQAGPVLLMVLSFVIAFGFLVQLRTWYNNHQRTVRLAGYDNQVDNLKHTMTHIETVANRSMALLKSIEKVVKSPKNKGIDKIS